MLNLNGRHYKEFNKIVTEDLYRVRHWKQDAVDYIVDVGANVGIFSLLMRMLHPQAKIVALEPANEAYPYLDTIGRVFSINIERAALGNGNPLYFRKRNMMLDAMFTEERPDNDTYVVDSVTLPEVFARYELDYSKNYLIKLDCEGGEHHLIDNKGSELILSGAIQVSMEIHFRSKATPFAWWPEWDVINSWVRDTFIYHHIDYYTSNKRRGFGHYCIMAK